MQLTDSVSAILVTNGDTHYKNEWYFQKALYSLLNQTYVPECIFVVDVSRNSTNQEVILDVGKHRCKIYFLEASKAKTFAECVNIAVNFRLFPSTAKWLYLLHDDSAPNKTSIERLLHRAASSKAIAVVGSKQIEWGSNKLINVSYTTTKSGRRWTGITRGEVDQKQHDEKDDVLGVSVTGSLIKKSVFDKIGGLDSEYGNCYLSLDFTKRVWLSGDRVVIAPDSIVEHKRAFLLGYRQFIAANTRRSAFEALEDAVRFDVWKADVGQANVGRVEAGGAGNNDEPDNNADTNTPTGAAPGTANTSADTGNNADSNPTTDTTTGAAANTSTDRNPNPDTNPDSKTLSASIEKAKERSYLSRKNGLLRYRLSFFPRFLLPFFYIYTFLAIPLKIANELLQKHPTRAQGELIIPLLSFLKVGSILRHRKQIRKASSVSPRFLRNLLAGTQEVKEYREAQKLADEQDSKLELPDFEEEELNKRNSSQRKWFAWLCVLLASVTLLLFAPYFGKLFTGQVFVGGALLPSFASIHDLFNAATTNWIQAGTGYNLPPNPLLLVLVIPSIIFGMSLQNALTAIVLLSILLSGIFAFASCGVITRKGSIRFFVGLAWALSIPFLSSLADGRIAFVIAYTLFPLIPLGLIRGLGLQTSNIKEVLLESSSKRIKTVYYRPSFMALAGASIAMMAVISASPGLFIPFLLFCIILFFVVGKGLGGRIIMLVVPSIAIMLPTLWFIVRNLQNGSYRVLLADSNPALQYKSVPLYKMSLLLPSELPLSLDDFSNPLHTALWVACLVLGGFLAIIALWALFINRHKGAVKMAWVLIILGLLGSFVSTNTAISYSDGYVYAWPGSFIALILFGELICFICVCNGKVRSSAHGRGLLLGSKLTRAAKACLTLGLVSLGVSLVVPALTVIQQPESIQLKVSEPALVPGVGVQMQNLTRMRVLLVKPVDDKTVNYELLRGANLDFADSSTAVSVHSLLGDQNPFLSEVVGQIITSPSDDAVKVLQDFGVGGILIPANASDNENYSQIIAAVNSAKGVHIVIENQSIHYWRLDKSDDSKFSLADYDRALESPRRHLWMITLFILLGCYLLLAVPFISPRRRKHSLVIEQEENRYGR
jgi:GT2 family glycosyltransferase